MVCKCFPTIFLFNNDYGMKTQLSHEREKKTSASSTKRVKKKKKYLERLVDLLDDPLEKQRVQSLGHSISRVSGLAHLIWHHHVSRAQLPSCEARRHYLHR